MTNEQIKEKYGIEPIMKEMWVWDKDIKYAKQKIVLCKDNRVENDTPYRVLDDWYRYASETNPNSKEPEVGDWGWFWDDGYAWEKKAVYSRLSEIDNGKRFKFYDGGSLTFQYFSTEKPCFLQ